MQTNCGLPLADYPFSLVRAESINEDKVHYRNISHEPAVDRVREYDGSWTRVQLLTWLQVRRRLCVSSRNHITHLFIEAQEFSIC